MQRRRKTRSLSFLCLVLGLSISAPLHAAQYSITTLDILPGGLDSLAFGLNDIGQVVGDSRLDRTGNVGQSRPVVWDYSGVPHELWSDQTVGASLAGINNVGQIVGRYGTGSGIPTPGPGVPFGRAFIWDEQAAMQAIMSNSNSSTRAWGINDDGDVVGFDDAAGAFRWSSTGGYAILPFPAGTSSIAYDINNNGIIVGEYQTVDSGPRTFMWSQSVGIVDLETLLPPASGWDLEYAFAINDAGDIVGYGLLNDQIRGFLMTPVPEPSAIAFAWSALGVIAF